MAEDTLRNRKKSTATQNEVVKHNGEMKYTQSFVERESTLTILMQSSGHIKAIYHIFVVILLILLLDTAIYDFVETGKINLGLRTVVNGFGDFKRGLKLWLFEFCLALMFYPSLRIYEVAVKLCRKHQGVARFVRTLGISGLVILQVSLVAVPSWDLKREHLAVGSAAAVTCEMFRFVMKIHAVTIACAPRCHTGEPLPSFQHYLYFLFAPTLIYKDKYPRTKKIRWGVSMFHILEVAAIISYNSFLWERFILPYWSDYGKQTEIEAGIVVRGMFACVLPGVISYLCGFYCVLHAWFNATAECLKFGDRQFYEDWWTKSQFSKYFKAWNMVVYRWLHEHIYRPLAPRAGRTVAGFTVFFVSGVAHEVILALSFGFFYPVLLLEFAVFGFLMISITASAGQRFPSIFNLFMWFSFFLGNGLLWSLYSMEYFARQNCPPTENDSFFIPKSWSCPKVILKPNWTFHNPLDIIN